MASGSTSARAAKVRLSAASAGRAPPSSDSSAATASVRSRPRFSTLESAAFSRCRRSSSPATGAARSISAIRNSRTSRRAGPSFPSAAIRSRSASFSFQAAWSRSTISVLSESAREPVEELARCRGVEELPRLGLAVEDEEARRQLGERPECGRRAVDEEAPLPARGDLAPHDDLGRSAGARLAQARGGEGGPRRPDRPSRTTPPRRGVPPRRGRASRRTSPPRGGRARRRRGTSPLRSRPSGPSGRCRARRRRPRGRPGPGHGGYRARP